MEQEAEEITEEVKNTGSQKSATTSNVYSADFTDYSSDKNYSSGKETYVIDWEDSDDSEESCKVHREQNVLNLIDEESEHLVDTNEIKTTHCVIEHPISNVACAISHNSTVVAQETFTQTSKTIIELAESDGVVIKSAELKTLQTQTSYVSVTQHKNVEYKCFSSNTVLNSSYNNWDRIDENNGVCPILTNSLEDRSSKFPESESDNEEVSNRSDIKEEESMIKNLNEKQTEVNSVSGDNSEASFSSSSDVEDDSLMEFHCNHKKDEKDYSCKNSDLSCTSKSTDNEVEDLYNNVSNCLEVLRVKQNIEPQFDSQWFGALTPLTEESTVKKESYINMTPCLEIASENIKKDKDEVIFTQDTGFKVKLLRIDKDTLKSNESFKLPPLQNNQSYPTTLNFLLSANDKGNSSSKERSLDRWELRTKDLAAGENQFINGKNPSRLPNEVFQLPPIHVDGVIQNIYTNYSGCCPSSITSKLNLPIAETPCDSISIHDKIRELTMTEKRKKNFVCKGTRSISPTSASSPEGSKLYDAALKGCDALCTELLRKLKSSSWCEVVDTLEEIPKVMHKFWNVVTEFRIADLLRQVTVHVDSPRSQVARTACITLSCILKNTNYTRKPDFYEAVTALLVKTGSFSRPVRRAANMALDDIVCGVDFTHAVTALCVHGVGHKSPLVRCASARLLVVCCALSGGGRGLLRARPPSAATARRSALRALADLLQDKATDARKYAERLYIMLRPLANFEAYFLTDVDVELATKQMKKYDQLLMFGSKDR